MRNSTHVCSSESGCLQPEGDEPVRREAHHGRNKIKSMGDHRIEISRDGKRVTVQALHVRDKDIISSGRTVRIARIHDEEWLATELEDPEACMKELRRSGLSADLFTFTQKPPDTTPRYGYPVVLESIAAARTADFQGWWQSLPQETRKNVRRSQKRGVVVTVNPFEDELVKGIAAVNNESRMRQGRANKHYGKSLDEVRKDHESFVDRSDFVCAYLERELIGYLKLVYRGGVASILNIVSKTSHHDKRPSNALLAKAMELCNAKGLSHLIYGKYYYGKKRNSQLLDFKVRHGFCEILMPRFYVPLTKWGEVCLRLKLYRTFFEIVPPEIIEMGLRVRAQWYNARNRCAGVAQW